MTNELDFLKDYGGSIHEEAYQISMDTEDAKKALADYAKQLAIGFAEWAGMHNWAYFHNDRIWSKTGVLAVKLLTTAELYDLYLKSLTQ